MSDTSTVFQAEIEAINHACLYAIANTHELNFKYIKYYQTLRRQYKLFETPG